MQKTHFDVKGENEEVLVDSRFTENDTPFLGREPDPDSGPKPGGGGGGLGVL